MPKEKFHAISLTDMKKTSKSKGQNFTRNAFPQAASKRVDPLKVLPPELIIQLINFLSPFDTETIRRISKAWKAASERTVNASWIAEHFPSSPESVRPFVSQMTLEEQNLTFRRLLYCQETQLLGKATGYFCFDNFEEEFGQKWILQDRLFVVCLGARYLVYDLPRIWKTEDLRPVEMEVFIVFGQVLVEMLHVYRLENGDIVFVYQVNDAPPNAGVQGTDTWVSRHRNSGEHVWAANLPRPRIHRPLTMVRYEEVLYWIEEPNRKICRFDLGRSTAPIDDILFADHGVSFVPGWLHIMPPIPNAPILMITGREEKSCIVKLLLVNLNGWKMLWMQPWELTYFVPGHSGAKPMSKLLQIGAHLIKQLETRISAHAMVHLLRHFTAYMSEWYLTGFLSRPRPFDTIAQTSHTLYGRLFDHLQGTFLRGDVYKVRFVRQVGERIRKTKYWLVPSAKRNVLAKTLGKTHQKLNLRHWDKAGWKIRSGGDVVKVFFCLETAGQPSDVHVLNFIPTW